MENVMPIQERKETGKGHNRRLRMSGSIPAVLYGLGDHKSVTVDPKPIHATLLQEGGKNRVFTVKGAGLDGKRVLIKDYQVDPVTRRLLHVDLFEIDVTHKVEITIALNFTGKAKGVVDGGILTVVQRNIDVRCLPDRIVNHIDVDVTSLIIGASLHLSDITLPEGIESATSQNPSLVTVVPPTKDEELQASLAPAAAPEVITEKKPAEGEEAAADKDKKDDKKEK